MNLLIQDSPHVFSPNLAKVIGLHECLMLQQLHWLIQNNDCKYYDNHFWWKHTKAQWLETLPYFQNEKRVLKTVKNLRSRNLLVAETLTWKIERVRGDRTLWYRVNYDEVERLSKLIESEKLEKKIAAAKAKNEPVDPVNTGNSQNGSMGHTQFGSMSLGQNGRMIKKIDKEDLLSKSVTSTRARNFSGDRSGKEFLQEILNALRHLKLPEREVWYATLKAREYIGRFPDSTSVADACRYVANAVEHAWSLEGFSGSNPKGAG